MTDKIDNGGPAFPQHVAPAYRQEPEIWGMSLRDYFAGQALTGICARRALGDEWTEDDAVEQAFNIADLMLAARRKQ